MPSYTVIEAQEVRRLPAKDNFPEKAVDNYTLKDGQSNLIPVYDFRALNAPLPGLGSQLEGEVTDQRDRFDPERRRFKKPSGGGGGFRRRDPAETRAIQRQHSQEMALRFIAIKAQLGALPDMEGKQGFDLGDVFTITDAFDRDLDPAPVQKSDIPFDENA